MNIPSFEMSPFEMSPEEKDIVNDYNCKADFKQSKIQVKIGKYTQLEARTGKETPATLSRDSEGTGMYWIIKGEEGSYLVPKYDKRFNSHVMQSMEIFFDCHGYVKGQTDPSKFRLKKPAKVTVMSYEETWVLDRKGILDFSG